MNKCNIISSIIIFIILCIFTYLNSRIDRFANQCILIRRDKSNIIATEIRDTVELSKEIGDEILFNKGFIPFV